MTKYMVLTDLTDWYEGFCFEIFDNLDEAKKYYLKDFERGYSSALIEYSVINNFRYACDEI